MHQHPLGALCCNLPTKGVFITCAREITTFQTEVRKECYASLKLLILDIALDLIAAKPDRSTSLVREFVRS